MSESPDKFRFIRFRVSDDREMLEKLKYMSRTLRGSHELRQFWELAERGDLEQHLKRFEFKRDFPKFFN